MLYFIQCKLASFANKMNSFLCTFLCSYAYLKFLFGYSDSNNFQQIGNRKRFYLRLIFIILSILVWVLLACLILPLLTFRAMVDVYLRIKLNSAYGGILKGQDSSMHSVRGKTFIRAVIIINDNKQDPDIWKSCLKSARKLYGSSYKLSSIVQNCWGYYYYLKNQVTFEDVVEEVRISKCDTITKDDFLDFVNNTRHPDSEERLFIFQYFPQPILWNNKDKTTKQYAIMITVQHCLADGPNLIKHMMKIVMGNKYILPHTNLLMNMDKMHKPSIDDAYITHNPLYLSDEAFPNAKGKRKEQFLAIYTEETRKYLSLLKKVKNTLGIGFTSVLVGAVSSSLNDYLKKKQQPSGNLVLLALIRPEEVNLIFKSKTEDPLINDFGAHIIQIPAKLAAMTTDDRLKAINESLNKIRRSVTATLIYMITNYMSLLPSAVQTLVADISLDGVTAEITNMSGLNNLRFAGHDVESSFFYISHNINIAFQICVMSVDGRLQLTLFSNNSYVSSREELQDILEGMLEHIDKFAKDLQVA